MTRTFAPSSEFFNTADAGGSGGGQMSSASGQGTGSGGGTQGAGAASGGTSTGTGQAPAPISLTPDSMVMLPGQTAPVKWSEYSSQYVPRTQAEQQQQAAIRSLLTAAQQAKQQRGHQQQRQQQQQQQQQRPDMFAGVRDMPLIDGKSLADLGERIQREGIGPLYEWAGQVNNLLEKVNQRLQGTERVAGSLVENRSRGEFEGKMSKAAQSLAQEVFPGIDISKHPVINDFVQDVYLSYDPNDPSLEREFPGLLKARAEGILKLAADLNQAKLQAARQQRRQFLRPGGQGHPSGQGSGQRLSHRDIARNMFANDASAT